MTPVTLFSYITPEEQERMRICFDMHEAVYRNNETVMEYSSSMKKIGLILEGQAVLYCIDEDGESQHYYVCAKSETRVLFIAYEHVIKRCENACKFHSQLVSNLLQMIALRASQQANRIYVLSRNSVRKKIMAYLNSVAGEKQSKCFTLSMSYTTLAEYLSVDRSAMMREMKNLVDEGIIERDGKKLRILESKSS